MSAPPVSPVALPTTTPRLSRPHGRTASSSTTPTRFRPSSSVSASVLSFLDASLRQAVSLIRSARSVFFGLPPLQRCLVALLFVVAFTASLLLLIFSHAVFAWLAPLAQRWRALPGGWILVWLLVFVTAFPPMVGYSFATTLAGFVFGFPAGWPIVASAAVAGSLAAFLASRGVLSGYVHRLVGKDPRFLALGQVLRNDGLLVLAMIRFCPLPFSLSNGFLATIPSVSPWAFAVGTAISTPKLVIHVFLGSRLSLLAEHGDTMNAGDKMINYLSMFLGATVGMVVGLFIYRRTMARAAEIARQAGPSRGADGVTAPATTPREQDYADLEAGLLDPDEAAQLMDDDDLSLWEASDVTYTDEYAGVGNGHGGGNAKATRVVE